MWVVDVDINRDEGCPETWQLVTYPRRLCLGYVPRYAFAHFNVKGE